VKQSNNLKGKLETALFLPEGKGWKGKGGLRDQGYFKNSYKNKPLISIVTVIFNGKKFLEETILSVINQSYDNVEYIVIDGGSTDGSINIIKKYEDKIDYWVSEQDRGIFHAMNKGALLSSGDFVYYLNAGDMFFSDQVLSNVFNSKKIFSQYNLIVGNVLLTLDEQDFGFSNRIGLNIPHQGVFIARTIFINIRFNEELKVFGDASFWSEMDQNGLFLPYLIDDVIARFPMDGVGSDPKYIWLRFKESVNLLLVKRQYSRILRRFMLSLLGFIMYKMFGKRAYFNFYIKPLNYLIKKR